MNFLASRWISLLIQNSLIIPPTISKAREHGNTLLQSSQPLSPTPLCLAAFTRNLQINLGILRFFPCTTAEPSYQCVRRKFPSRAKSFSRNSTSFPTYTSAGIELKQRTSLLFLIYKLHSLQDVGNVKVRFPRLSQDCAAVFLFPFQIATQPKVTNW